MFHPTIIICSLISIILGIAVIYKPLLSKPPASYFKKDTNRRFYMESIGILEMLKDLESDYQSGKISRQDFEELSLEFKHQYLEKKQQEAG